MIVTPEKSVHWYQSIDDKIVPCYEIPKKSGDGMKAVTLREAKELGLLYSVTKVCDVMRKPALEAWKQEQAILSALTLPRIADEPLDSFSKRVAEDMEAQSEKAKQRGTAIHQAIADYLEGYYPNSDMEPWLKGFMDWADNELKTNPTIPQCEMVVGSKSLGIGGRLDCLAELNGRGMCVVDYKSQNVKSNGSGIKKPVWYPEWPIQLAAYEQCLDGFQNLVSVIIDTSEPGPVFVKQWEDPGQYWEMFEHCYALTCHLNDYDPRQV